MKSWTTKEIDYVKHNALLAETNEALNIKEMAKKLDRSQASVKSRVYNLQRNGDLPKVDKSKAFDSKGRPWNKEEDKKLIAMKKRGATHVEIAAELERSVTSVNSRSHRLKQEKKIKSNRTKWTDEEVALLSDNITYDENGFVNNYPELVRIIGKRYEQIQIKVGWLRKNKEGFVSPKKGTTSAKSKQAMNNFNDARFSSTKKKEVQTVKPTEQNTKQEAGSDFSVQSCEVILIATTTTLNDRTIKQFFTKSGELVAQKELTTPASI